MNPLLRRLASLRRTVLLLEGWRGLCAVVALVVGVFTLVGVVDWHVHLPSLVRAVLLFGVLGGAGVVAYRYLARPLAAPRDDLSLALRIEEEYPELNDALASTVQFLQHGGDSPAAGSVAMRERAIQQTITRAKGVDFGRIVDRRGVVLFGVAALLVGAVAGYLAYRAPDTARTAALRLADPFGVHPWTSVEMPDTPTRVAIGSPFVIRGHVGGIVPAQAKVEVISGTFTDKVVPIKLNAETQTGTLVTPLDMTQHKGTFKFRVLANDGSYPPRPGSWHEVEVVPPPELANLHGVPSPQIELHVPAYTDLPSPVALPPGTRQLEVLAGTQVVLRAAANRPLAAAWVEYRPESELVWKGAMLSFVGQTTLPALGAALAGGQAVWGRQPAELDADRTVFAVRFQPWVTGSYLLHIQDDDGLAKRYAADLRVLPDPLPAVKLQKPETSMTVLPDAEVSFRFQVEDEMFAIRSVFVEYARKKDDGTAVDAEPKRVVLYDGPAFGPALPRLLTAAAPSLRLRPKQLDFVTRWALRNEFREGDTVRVQVCADDFCDVYTTREPGRSHEIELRIVGKSELAKVVDDKLAEVQQDLVRLQKMQQDALDLVKGLQNKEKPTQQDRDQLIEAETVQKSIRERIGQTGDEGMRNELNKLLQLLKDNKLTDTEAKEKAGMLKGELDRLAKNELQQIEPNLSEARKEVSVGEKNKDALNRAAKLQESAKNSLDELAAQLNPWASLHEIKGEARDIRNKQQDLKQAFENIRKHERPADPKEAQLQEDADRKDQMQIADEQKRLADRTEKLVRKMKDAQDKRTKANDKESAQRLADAAQVAEQSRLPQRMQNVAEELKNDPKKVKEHETLQQQARAVENLDKMMNALEGKKDELTDRLQKKQKKNLDAQDNVEKLAKKMKDLQQKVQDANQIGDAKEKQKKLQELAEEHEKLKEEVEKNARELARLEEPRASDDLHQAAEELDNAAKKLRQNLDPEEEQQQAQERIEQAKQELEQTEEELARERLAKFADKLKGLKERQEALESRSRDFQNRLLEKKHWTEGLLDSLQGDATSQKGVAEETKALAEKLKEAKVFENILQRAVKDMDQAADVMEGRRKEGLENLPDPLDAEPFKKEDLDLEARRHDETVKYQKAAARRLDRLLNTLKEELAKKEEKKEPEQKEGGMPPEQQQNRMRAGDGIPPAAQIKALKAEQEDVHERTKDFGRRHPDTNNLMPDQQRELTALREDQERIHTLFQQMMADQKGDQP